MKNKVKTIEDVFINHLQQLFYTETMIKNELSQALQPCCPRLREEILEYTESSDNKLLKLERIFNYLMREPSSKKTLAVADLIEETSESLDPATPSHIGDIVLINTLRSINACKIAYYKTAYLYAVELELDTPADLLHQILKWEVECSKTLAKLAVEHFNNLSMHELSNIARH